MKFIDLQTGYIYDGLKPYTHFFPGEQSTDLIYSHRLCFIHDNQNVDVSINSNIFHIIDSTKLGSTNDYKRLLTPNTFTSIGKEFNDKYIHMIYLTAQSSNPGEYRTTLKIDTEEVMIGADFYDINESLYINLSNFGVELPGSIQKALYSVNINEGNRDNITLNRKMKELLSNYWDILAGRGNYKSLIDGLKWFEWGDLLKIKEVWSREDFGRVVYDTRSLCSVLEDKYNDLTNEFKKTTYISLSAATQTITKELDEEKNPAIENIVTQWTREELQLKLCLLGYFYKTYFMPIHLELLHSTIENVVYTNTVKIISGNSLGREDFIYNTDTFKCNITDDSEYVLSNVECQVGGQTMFGKIWAGETYEEIGQVGVEKEVIFNQIPSENDLKTFYSQIYKGVGVLVDVVCLFNLEKTDNVIIDPIIESKIIMNGHLLKSHEIINSDEISFTLLFKHSGKQDIGLSFKTAGGRIYSKNLTINIIEPHNVGIKIYRVKHYPFTNLTDGRSMNNYLYSRNRNHSENIIQYISTASDLKNTGVCLNNILILKGDYINDHILNNHYYITSKTTESAVYTICISKNYWFSPESSIFDFDVKYGVAVYRNDYGFFPEFHYLDEICGDDIKNYIIRSGDVIAVVPELPLGMDVKDVEWEFKNVSRGTTVTLQDIQEPFVGSQNGLETGYYDIIFRYRLDQNEHTFILNSAFVKK